MPGRYRRGAVYAFYFLAGLCGLTNEVVWSRLVGTLLGDTDLGNALVLGTFMAGLALGARLFGPRADASRHPLRLYGFLELGIGLFGLLSPLLLAGPPPETPALRFALALAAILPPTVLMGGAFPLLARYLTARTTDLRPTIGLLYALNTAGAVLGGLFAGFLLLRWLSPSSALAATGLVDLGQGLCVLALARQAPARLAAERPALGLADAVDYGPGARRLALGLAAFSGVASMALEVAWTRDLAAMLGDSTHGLTLMLAAFLSGSALGALLLVSPRAGRVPLPDLLARALLATGLLIAGARGLYGALAEAVADGLALEGPLYAACFLMLLLPATAGGLVFPAAVRLAADERHVGGRVGGVYALNTLGTLGGAALASAFILPAWGSGGVFVAAAVAYGSVGTGLLWRTFSATTRNWRPRSSERV